jgi:hypothetical protein
LWKQEAAGEFGTEKICRAKPRDAQKVVDGTGPVAAVHLMSNLGK